MLIRQEMQFLFILTLTVCTATAVGPVMNQQPTVFDVIQNEPDLSEVITFKFYQIIFQGQLHAASLIFI